MPEGWSASERTINYYTQLFGQYSAEKKLNAVDQKYTLSNLDNKTFRISHHIRHS